MNNMTAERLKPGGRRKSYPAEANEGNVLQPGRRIIIELEAVSSHEGLMQIASLDYEDLLGGNSVSGVFKVNRFEVS